MVLRRLLLLLQCCSVFFSYSACNETAGRGGRERIKVLFTPSICKVRCTSGRCVNFCENGNITALYSHEPESRPAGGPGFRIFLCPMLCQNGGVCIHKDRCLCPPAFTGKFCHIPTPASTNDIEKLPSSPSVMPREDLLMHSEYLVPLQNVQQPRSNTSSSMVKVRVQHPPEASVKIHQVLKVGYEPAARQQSETVTRSSGLSGARSGLLLGERMEARPAQIQAQTVRGDSTYTESSGFKYCFREVRNGKCSSPLPGLRSQETCCRRVGKAWGINECILCPSYSGSGANGESCPKGFERINGTQCVDVNECLQSGFCENGNCVNTRGSYTCVCNQGYLLDASHGICISEKVISEDKGQCYRLLTSRMCSLPILRNITKQICCCSRVGKAWGKNCEKCPYFGSAGFKEICPAGPGYQYSSSAVKLNQILLEHFGAEGPPLSPQNRSQQLPVTVDNVQQGRPTLLNVLPTQVLTAHVPRQKFSQQAENQSISPVRPGPPVRPLPVPSGPPPVPPRQDAPQTCDVNPLVCGSGRCVDQPGGRYTCICNPGYQLNPQQTRCQDVDECKKIPTPCANGQCQNIQGGYRCICPVGYLPGPQDRSCIDLNECLQTPKPCSFGQCKNTPGSYTCVCLTGFRENPQQTKCLDIDECQQTPRPCGNGRCENSLGSYRCVCPSGYAFQGDACTDVNECEDPLQCPGQECVNSQGSYRCISCRPGFGLLNGQCSDIDECRRTPGPCVNSRCENTPGSYRCVCATGFQLHGNTCMDIDECKNTLQCPGQECVNSQGSFSCVACRPGFELKGKRCQDVDECHQKPCRNGHCENSPGSYQCVCSDGYEPEGGSCTDVDECKDPSQCPGQECVNTQGSHTCVPCRPGYAIQNRKCADVDECQAPETCGPESHCVNTDGSYSCSCRPGYRAVGPGRQCRDINECFEGEYCFPHGECMNTLGSYICVCSEGYKSSGNGSSCTDVDECSRPELCLDGQCINTQGSFQCRCNAGFATNPEKTACLDIDECAETGGTVCGPNRCENTIGSYHCFTTCEPGYSITPSEECVDIDECASDNICGDHAICQNFLGTYECICNRGYKAVANGKGCEDENECETMAGVCGAALCLNAEGSFVCECPGVDEEFDLRTRRCLSRPQSGRSDPLTSSDSRPPSQTHIASIPPPASQSEEWKECYYNTQQHSTCHILTRNSTHQECCCTIGEGWGLNCRYVPCPSPGSAEFQTLCRSTRGYVTTGSGAFSYRDVDECKLFHPEICKNGVCVNNIPGYSCYCPSGYYHDTTLLQCIDNDECEGEVVCTGGTCVNTVGSFYCFCEPPLVLDDTQRNCVNSSSFTTDEDLAFCWQQVTEDLVCQSPLLERMVTFTQCCCLYGEAWGLHCALCPAQGSDDFEVLCQTLRLPVFPPPFRRPYGSGPGPGPGAIPGEDYGPPYDTFPEPPPEGLEYVPPRYDGYSPPRGTIPRYRGSPRSSYGPRETPYGQQSSASFYEREDVERRYLAPEPEARPSSRRTDPLSEPAYDARPRLPSWGGPRSLAPFPENSPYPEGEEEEHEPDESRLPFLPREGPPYPEYRGRPPSTGGVFERRYESYQGLDDDECGILHGCENGRCVRVSEGYTCDCYSGYRLDISSMACRDINECDEAPNPETLCVNGRCVNTEGSYQCVCRQGYVTSRRPNYCIPARTRP